MIVNKIGIIGLGLIGGSLAKALKKSNSCNEIIALDHSLESLKQAYDENMINYYSIKLDSNFYDCDIIFLCMPVSYNIDFVKKLIPKLSKNCILTDVGSTKNDIISQIKTMNIPCDFIGGHPMTGSEKSGYKSSKSHLFENAFYILSPLKTSTKDHINIMENIIQNIGALPVTLESDLHDFVTASISHVPHVIASALVNMIEQLDTDDRYMHQLAAGGFKDITRIASSSPIMWQNICMANKIKVIEILEFFQNQLKDFTTILKEDNDKAIYDFFEDAKLFRNSFSDKKLGAIIKTYDITLDVEDKPGIIAEIATILSQESINIKNIGIINNREHTNGVLEICFYDKESQKQSIEILSDLNYTVYKK